MHEQESIDVSKSFQSRKAPGYDKVSMSLIKQCISFISRPLVHIINRSFECGIVPDQMKIARVIPLYTAGDYHVLVNYRPIFNSPSFSKYLERIFYNRLINFIDQFDILTTNPYGFRKGYSTSLALISLTNNISAAMDRKEYCIGIFLDLSKAFDAVNHSILLRKLQHYGIRGVALKWMNSYLSNRFQFVQYNEYQSVSEQICCGVPQGSILGPLLFLLYVNDIVNVSSVLHLILFCDDTSIFYSHSDLSYLVHQFNRQLQALSIWFKANKFSLNVDKTKFVLFRPRQRKCNFDINLCIDGRQIMQVKEFIFRNFS